MIWSYSRLTAYEDCKYAWLLKYIKKCKKQSKFFAQYGTFIHLILQKYLSGELERNGLVDYYIENFLQHVTAKAPNNKIFMNYFNQGKQYFKDIDFLHKNIIGIEEEVHFKIDNTEFVGYIDVQSDDENELCVTDHKSKELKERSKKRRKSDDELDKYLRQLYLYCIPMYEKYKRYPEWLEFNCFRTQVFIREKFDIEKLEETKKWATDKIKEITHNAEWTPNYDKWYCNHLCDVSDECYVMEINGKVGENYYK